MNSTIVRCRFRNGYVYVEYLDYLDNQTEELRNFKENIWELISRFCRPFTQVRTCKCGEIDTVQIQGRVKGNDSTPHFKITRPAWWSINMFSKCTRGGSQFDSYNAAYEHLATMLRNESKSITQ